MPENRDRTESTPSTEAARDTRRTSDAPGTPSTPGTSSPVDFRDVEAFVRAPRLASAAAGPDGRLVLAIQQADDDAARMVSSLWELDASGEAPARRLTFSEKGESAPRFAPDGSLLFTSARPDPAGGADAEASQIWRLPEHGEAQVVASAPGGLSLLAVADDGTLLASTSVLRGHTLESDAEARRERKDARRTAIWHTGMPVRQWDHEIGDEDTRLVLIAPDGERTDLTPDAGVVGLLRLSADLSPDGSQVATTWTRRVRGGETRSSIDLIDTATLDRTTLLAPGLRPRTGTAAGDCEVDWSSPSFSPDGRYLAVELTTVSSPEHTSYSRLLILPRTDQEGAAAGTPAWDAEAAVRVDTGDLTLSEVCWASDGTLLISGAVHSSGAILAVDPATGATRTIAEDGVFSSLAPAPDGALLALRSDIATPPRPVLLGSIDSSDRTDRTDEPGSSDAPGSRVAAFRELLAPGELGDLPGTLERVETEIDGVIVGGWLCVPSPASAAEPAPTMLWIHGGPHGSYNAWSWRWCPWLAVARGYAVLLPDPAMSTGYGDAGLNRGWPRRPDVVFAECEILLDRVLERPELDADRTALLGASFGGFMTNWIAGRSDRFDAIVTHAGLWALPQQHRTTDAAASKMRVHLSEEQLPDWYEESSPHRRAARITTPMLLTHGNRDYRVPVSEALRLWWDLVSGWDGAPETMPHRFLQLTSENHWVLTPSNAIVWNEAVLAFCDQHVLGAEPVPEILPW